MEAELSSCRLTGLGRSGASCLHPRRVPRPLGASPCSVALAALKSSGGRGVVGASGWLPSTSQDFFCVAVGIVGSFWNSLGPPLLPMDDAGSCRRFVSCRALRGTGELPRCPSSEVPACWGNVCGVLLGTHLALPFPPGCTRAGPGARVPWALLVVPWEKLKPPGSPDRERDGERCLLNLEPTQETNKPHNKTTNHRLQIEPIAPPN